MVKVTICPPAFAAPSSATISETDRTALRVHERALEELRQKKVQRICMELQQSKPSPMPEEQPKTPGKIIKMSDASMYEDMKKGQQETFRWQIAPSGHKTLYFEDGQGRKFFSLFSPGNRFQGTYPLNPPPEPK